MTMETHKSQEVMITFLEAVGTTFIDLITTAPVFSPLHIAMQIAL